MSGANFNNTDTPAVAGPDFYLKSSDVVVSGGNTLNLYNWTDRAVKLTECRVFSAVAATVGAYTLALAKDPDGTPANMLSAATFDMTSLSAFTPTIITLTATEADRTLAAGDLWRAQFVSDNAGLDAEGVYFQLTWEVV